MTEDFTGRMEELEKKLDFHLGEGRLGDSKISNKVEILNNGQRIIYEGNIYNLMIDEKNDLLGDTELIKNVPKQGKILCFKVEDNSIELWLPSKCSMPPSCLVHGGTMCCAYRNNLKLRAFNDGIAITDKLLGMIFDPIDRQIMNIYNKIFGERK